jgi:hypothetical protein
MLLSRAARPGQGNLDAGTTDRWACVADGMGGCQRPETGGKVGCNDFVGATSGAPPTWRLAPTYRTTVQSSAVVRYAAPPDGQVEA